MAEVFYFHVQEDRSIKYKLIEPIMQEDKDVATWRFRIPKVLNQIDMSGWSWWFVYVNAKGQTLSELLTLTDDIDDPSSYSTADYDIDYGISKFPGSFSFALEAISAQQGGEISGEWHTKTYKHKVDGTLQGNQAEYAETESDIISALMQEVRNKVNQLVGGATPLPVASVSAMTDTTKVYLNTTDKNWYYYNGTAWVSGGLYSKPTDEQTAEAVDNWLGRHPEATTTVQDGSITEAKLANGAVTDKKLTARLKILTNIDLNGIAYHENVILPITKSYVEAVTYLSGYYYAVCRDYSATPNTCYVAKYDSSFTLVNTVYTSATYGIANNIFNDGNRIYIDFDSGYHVSFDTSISDDFAIQNSNIRNMAFWNDTLYGIAINASNVTVYTVASDFTTISEVLSIATIRQTLQSASIIDGILFIPTTKGLFKFIDMEKQSMIAEIPYYDSKEIENFFKDKDGTVKCSGHFYGANGIFNIGIFNGGVDGAKMQYTDIDGTDGDYSAFASSSQRYGFYKISDGTAMGLPVDTGDLLLFEDARLFVSKTSNTIYAYSNNAWNLIGFLSGKRVAVKVNNNYILFDVGTDGRLTIRCDYLPITQAVTEVNVDLSSLYSALGFADNQSFTIYITGSTNSGNIAASVSEVYVAQIYIRKTQTNIYTRNVTQNSTANINAKFSFFETLR